MDKFNILDKWFTANYYKLKEKLFSVYFSEDAFHDAYLAVRDHSKGLLIDEKLYEAIFLAAYKAQDKKRMQSKYSIIHPENFVWGLLSSNILDENEDNNNMFEANSLYNTENGKFSIISKIRKYAKKNFFGDEYKIFEAYFIHSFNLENTSLYIGRSITFVSTRINKIRNMICSKFEDEIINL